MKRSSGVLMHISSLWGEYSCGSFGAEALEFVDFLFASGFKVWQVLPFCMADESNSPYKSFSAFAGNLYFVDLPTLFYKGYITKEELNEAKQKNSCVCEYQKLRSERFKLLKKASLRLDEKIKSCVGEFISSHPHIADFCCFMALKEANDGKIWTGWQTDKIDRNVLFAWQFIQYEFFVQWNEIRCYANKKGIKIIGDIPVYVSHDSSDVWANRRFFQLKKDGGMKAVAGVPPDYFSVRGQLWGNPLYNWEEMKRDGYLWWTDRLKAMFELFDGVRLDHFRALESYWAVDAGAKTAEHGLWLSGPGMDFIEKIKGVSENKIIIAEDLGIITDNVKLLVEKSGFPGMRVMQFGFLDDSDSLHLPHNYINNCIAYTGTHDNNTLVGYMQELCSEMRARLLEYCGCAHGDVSDCCECIIRTLFASAAGMVIIPVQDLLQEDSEARMNIPGVAEGNWQYRLTKKQLDSIVTNKYMAFNKLYKRI